MSRFNFAVFDRARTGNPSANRDCTTDARRHVVAACLVVFAVTLAWAPGRGCRSILNTGTVVVQRSQLVPAGAPGNADVAGSAASPACKTTTCFSIRTKRCRGYDLRRHGRCRLKASGWWSTAIRSARRRFATQHRRRHLRTDFETDDLVISSDARVLLEDKAKNQRATRDRRRRIQSPVPPLAWSSSAAGGTTLSNGGLSPAAQAYQLLRTMMVCTTSTV
jgi:hypothetical protein